MSTKAIILDLGGVCVYPAYGNWNIPVNFRDVLGKHADSVFTDAFEINCQKCSHLIDESAIVSSEEQEEQMRFRFYRAVDARMDWHLTERELFLLADSCTHADARYKLYSDVLPMLDAWHWTRQIAVLSDAMPSVLRIMDHAGMSPFLSTAVLSTQVGALKPDEKMYRAILQKLNCSPSSCIFVDDKAENLYGARALGIRAIQMRRENCPVNGLWDGEAVQNFQELDGILE